MCRAFRRPGYVQEAVYRQGWPVAGGAALDSVGYALLRGDWENDELVGEVVGGGEGGALGVGGHGPVGLVVAEAGPHPGPAQAVGHPGVDAGGGHDGDQVDAAAELPQHRRELGSAAVVVIARSIPSPAPAGA